MCAKAFGMHPLQTDCLNHRNQVIPAHRIRPRADNVPFDNLTQNFCALERSFRLGFGPRMLFGSSSDRAATPGNSHFGGSCIVLYDPDYCRSGTLSPKPHS